jgi:hypothetical protein
VTTLIEPPLAPEALVASNIAHSGFTANWTSVAQADGYRLDVSENSSFNSFIDGFNNKNVGDVTSFSITNLTPEKTYFYRLRSYNNNGVSSNSNTINVTTTPDYTSINEGEETIGIKIYPNPASSELWIEFINRSSKRLDIQLINLQGQIVDQKTLDEPGEVRTSFNVANLHPGVYLLILRSNEFNVVRKIVIQK